MLPCSACQQPQTLSLISDMFARNDKPRVLFFGQRPKGTNSRNRASWRPPSVSSQTRKNPARFRLATALAESALRCGTLPIMFSKFFSVLVLDLVEAVSGLTSPGMSHQLPPRQRLSARGQGVWTAGCSSAICFQACPIWALAGQPSTEEADSCLAQSKPGVPGRINSFLN